jgi:hypothetical protein
MFSRHDEASDLMHATSSGTLTGMPKQADHPIPTLVSYPPTAETKLSNRVFADYAAIVDAGCQAWARKSVAATINLTAQTGSGGNA